MAYFFFSSFAGAAAAAGVGSSAAPEGGARLATVKFLSGFVGLQPSGRLIAEICSDSLKSIPARSAVIASGMTTQTLLQTTNNNDSSSSFGIQTGVINPLASLITDIPTPQTNFLTNKADPINAIIESKSNTEEKKDGPNTSSVNRNAQNNEVAGGVDIASIAIQPPGFNQYASLVLRDAVFYTPKEIYRGQRTVDNARALRQLASDRLHQEMVDQQYLQR